MVGDLEIYGERNRMKNSTNKIIFIVISLFLIIGLGFIISADFFCHGFYCDLVKIQDINEEDYLGCIDLGEGAFETTFSPAKKHFAGFEIILENTSEKGSGTLSLSTYTMEGRLIETQKVEMSEISSAGWYMVYTEKNYKKDTVYKLSIAADDYEIAPRLLLVNNDYLTEEGKGNNLLIGYAYSLPTFSNVEKILIFWLVISIWIALIGELCLSSSHKEKYARAIAFILGFTVLLSWNYMFNSFDEENTDRFSSFQSDSDALVYGSIEAEKDGIWQSYGLGHYYVTRGEYDAQAEFANNDDWIYGYSKTEPKIMIPNNAYTQLFALTGTIVQFENGDMFTVTEVTEGGDNYIFSLNSSGPLNYYKYGDLGKAVFYSAEGEILTRYPYGVLEPYESQYGLQGKVFRYLSKYMDENEYTDYLRLICAFSTAFVFTLIVVLLYMKYNFLLAICFAITFLLSPWVVNFAGSVYWVEFTWFLPMLIGLVCSIWINRKRIRNICYMLAYISIVIKCLCGYEYISAVMMGLISFMLIDLAVAVIKRDRERTLLFFKAVFIMGCIAIAGFGTAICIHAFLRGEGNIIGGVKSIIREDVLRRVGGGSLNSFGQEYWPSLNASVWEVVRKYFHFKTDIIAGIDANIFPILCLTPVIIFINDYAKKSFNLEEVAMYIVFFLTGISWMVLGKSHSYIHTHINYVLWYFGFVQCCFYIILNRFGNYVHEKKGKKSD